MLESSWPPKKNCCGCVFFFFVTVSFSLSCKRHSFCCFLVSSQLGKRIVILASFAAAEKYLLGSEAAEWSMFKGEAV